MRWRYPLIGLVLGVALAYLLPAWNPGPHDGPLVERTYFFWDTMTRGWAAAFYALIGLGVGLAAALILRLTRSQSSPVQ